MLILLMLASVSGQAHAAAICPATSVDVENALGDAERAWAKLDAAGVTSATARASAEVACLGEAVAPFTVARMHRVEGLEAYLEGNLERSGQAFAAARAIEPAYKFPESLVPADHPVQKAWVAADPTHGTRNKVTAPASGHLEFDGAPTMARPVEWPTVALYFTRDGSVGASAYLWPADPMFAYDIGTTSKLASTTLAPANARRSGPNVPLAVTTLVSLAASGACLAGNRVAAADDSVDTAEGQSARYREHGFYIASAGFAAVGLGLGAAAVIAGHW